MTSEAEAPFDAPDERPDAGEGQLVVDLEGYEGPIDMLLALARDQKVDLTHISILALADQYLAYIAAARRIRLEIAADYLVMAAWLAYLKSRLLLPEQPVEAEVEPTAAEMAAALSFQLRRLQAMQEVGAKLMARAQLGRDVFGRGAPEGLSVTRRSVYAATLYDLLSAYGDHHAQRQGGLLLIEQTELYSMEAALERLSGMLGRMPEWTTLTNFLPPGLGGGLVSRSAIAAMLTASLELARTGRVQIRQDQTFGPVYLRRAPEGTVTEFVAPDRGTPQ